MKTQDELITMDTNGNSKELLLKDLCSRLPYGVICKLSAKGANVSITEKLDTGGLEHFIFGTMDVKPFLRPMFSMTEEEYKEMNEVLGNGEDAKIFLKHPGRLQLWLESCETDPDIWMEDIFAVIDWLLEHHFDMRNLIERGLAIDCTGLNIY